MKVALIVDEFSIEKGTGIARYSYELFQGLKERGVYVEPIMMKLYHVPFGEAINHIFGLPYNIIKKVGDFDIIHATSPITGLCFPFIRKPKVMTYHDIITLLLNKSGNSLHARMAAPLFFRAGNWCDRIITVSSQTRNEIIDHLNIHQEKIIVIKNGINNDLEPLEKKERDSFTIGYLGAFTLRKKIDDLIIIFDMLKKEHADIKLKLAICGEKRLEYNNLIKLAKDLDLLDVIEFRGFIPQEKLCETYNSFDIFALTSEWEGFCIPVIEAQRCGVPVVIREDAHIPDEVSKYCIKAGSKKEMVENIHKLLTDPLLKEDIVEKGIEYSQQFSWNRTVDETLEVYKEVLSGKARA